MDVYSIYVLYALLMCRARLCISTGAFARVLVLINEPESHEVYELP